MVEEDAELMSSYGHTKAAITYTATLSQKALTTEQKDMKKNPL